MPRSDELYLSDQLVGYLAPPRRGLIVVPTSPSLILLLREREVIIMRGEVIDRHWEKPKGGKSCDILVGYPAQPRGGYIIGP